MPLPWLRTIRTLLYQLVTITRFLLSHQSHYVMGLICRNRVVYEALTKRAPPVRIACVYKSLFAWWLPLILPARLVDRMFASVFGIQALPRLKKEEWSCQCSKLVYTCEIKGVLKGQSFTHHALNINILLIIICLYYRYLVGELKDWPRRLLHPVGI